MLIQIAQSVGMVAGVLLSVGLGFIAIYTSHTVGRVKILHPHVNHYADVRSLTWNITIL